MLQAAKIHQQGTPLQEQSYPQDCSRSNELSLWDVAHNLAAKSHRQPDDEMKQLAYSALQWVQISKSYYPEMRGNWSKYPDELDSLKTAYDKGKYDFLETRFDLTHADETEALLTAIAHQVKLEGILAEDEKNLLKFISIYKAHFQEWVKRTGTKLPEFWFTTAEIDQSINKQQVSDKQTKDIRACVLKPKTMLDVEIQDAIKFIKLPFFVDALQFSPLSNGSEPTKIFNRLLVKGLPLYFSEPGYCFDDEIIPKVDVKRALSRINSALFDTDIPRMTIFTNEVIKTESGNQITMVDILIGREDVARLYSEMGFEFYPWVKLPWPESASDFIDYPVDKPKFELSIDSKLNAIVSGMLEVGNEIASTEPVNVTNRAANKSKVDDNVRGRRNNQVTAICNEAKNLTYDLLKIPEGGKQAIKTKCLENISLFTKSGFDHAWKEANRSKKISMENKQKYS